MTIMKWGPSGQGYKQLTRFSRFGLFKPAASTMQRLSLLAASIFVTEGLFMYIYFLLFEENHQNQISAYIHFNVPPGTRITDLVKNVSDEKIYY